MATLVLNKIVLSNKTVSYPQALQSVFATLSNGFDAIAKKAKQHNAIKELNDLSDRELADIGIARGNIKMVVLGQDAV